MLTLHIEQGKSLRRPFYVCLLSRILNFLVHLSHDWFILSRANSCLLACESCQRCGPMIHQKDEAVLVTHRLLNTVGHLLSCRDWTLLFIIQIWVPVSLALLSDQGITTPQLKWRT